MTDKRLFGGSTEAPRLTTREQEHRAIAEQTAAFLEAGGCIEEVPFGASKDNDLRFVRVGKYIRHEDKQRAKAISLQNKSRAAQGAWGRAPL